MIVAYIGYLLCLSKNIATGLLDAYFKILNWFKSDLRVFLILINKLNIKFLQPKV